MADVSESTQATPTSAAAPSVLSFGQAPSRPTSVTPGPYRSSSFLTRSPFLPRSSSALSNVSREREEGARTPVVQVHERGAHRIEELADGIRSELSRSGRELREIEEDHLRQLDLIKADHRREIDRYLQTIDDLRERNRRQDEQLGKSAARVSALELEVRSRSMAAERELAERDARIDALRQTIDRLQGVESTAAKLRSDQALLQTEAFEREAKLKAEVRRLQSELGGAVEAVQRSEQLLDLRAQMLQDKQRQIDELSGELHSVSTEQRQALHRTTVELHERESLLRSTELKTSLQEERLQKFKEDVKALTKINNEQAAMIRDLEAERNAMGTEISKLKVELDRALDQINILRSRQADRLDRDSRLEQLTIDNARLAKMLYSTGQFKEFFQYSAEQGGIVYVPPHPPTREDIADAPATYTAEPDRPTLPKTEWQHWVPQEAAELGRAFQNRYLSSVREDIFADLLVQLNQVWRRRETLKINQLKAKHADELRTMRRVLTQRLHYEDVVQMERITHLKKELQRAKSPHSRRIVDMKGTVLDSTLSTVEHLSTEVEYLRRENAQLRRSVSAPAPPVATQDSDFFFLEGAAWMGRKVLDISDRMADKVNSTALDLQNQLIMESARPYASPAKLSRTQTSFVQKLESQIGSFRDKLRRLLEKVLTSIEDKEVLDRDAFGVESTAEFDASQPPLSSDSGAEQRPRSSAGPQSQQQYAD